MFFKFIFGSGSQNNFGSTGSGSATLILYNSFLFKKQHPPYISVSTCTLFNFKYNFCIFCKRLLLTFVQLEHAAPSPHSRIPVFGSIPNRALSIIRVRPDIRLLKAVIVPVNVHEEKKPSTLSATKNYWYKYNGTCNDTSTYIL